MKKIALTILVLCFSLQTSATEIVKKGTYWIQGDKPFVIKFNPEKAKLINYTTKYTPFVPRDIECDVDRPESCDLHAWFDLGSVTIEFFDFNDVNSIGSGKGRLIGKGSVSWGLKDHQCIEGNICNLTFTISDISPFTATVKNADEEESELSIDFASFNVSVTLDAEGKVISSTLFDTDVVTISGRDAFITDPSEWAKARNQPWQEPRQ